MQHSLLLFPTPDVVDPARKFGGDGTPHFPSVNRQFDRLGPKFSRLETALDNRAIEVQGDVDGINPEYTVVIETFGAVSEFFKAVRKIEGLEWLGEYEVEDLEPTEDFYSKGKDETKLLRGQVMLMLSDRRAIDDLLSLWRRYGDDPDMKFQRGWAKFRDLFRLIKDIRYWDVQDRLNHTGIIEDWEERLEYDGDAPIRFEAELWYRKNEAKQNEAVTNITRLVNALDGQVVNSYCLPDIHYQSLLLELPAIQISNILEHENVSLVRCDQVMFFKPLGQMTAGPLLDGEGATVEQETEDQGVNQDNQALGTPRVALLDGLPLTNHVDLSGNVIVDDPDDYESNYPVENRVHGTAMASLIVNGDLGSGANKLTSPLYARPIMKPDPLTMRNTECLPDDELPLDIIHRAVRRIFDGDGEEAAVAPSVKVINISIGDPNIHFNGKMSPLARLLDWLSAKYNVLFIVSAGNHVQDIEIDMPAAGFRNLSDEDKAKKIFNTIQRNSWNRKLLSPAESINSITVGATHDDSSQVTLRGGFYNIYDVEMPATYSAHGNGYLRAVKPDIVMSGGRILHNEPLGLGRSSVSSVLNYAAPGQLVSAPHSSAANHRNYIRGTSNSTALITRSCVEIDSVVAELFHENELSTDYEMYASLLLKALVTHGASWEGMYELISGYLDGANKKTLQDIVTRNIGYGKPDIDRVKYCLDTRATILGYGELNDSEAHVYKLPIPDGLVGAEIWRRLTVTLSWFSNPRPANMKYRDSSLWFALEGSNKKDLVSDRTAAQWQQVKRGTLQHEIFEGQALAVISEDRMLEIKVNCKDDASKIEAPVKYALAITLEVAEGTDIQLYQEIELKINEQIQEQTGIPIRAGV